MTTVFSVDSGRCDHKSQITAERNGNIIAVKIESTCQRVRAYGLALGEVSIKDLAQPILKNPIYTVASQNLGPECVVPCAVVSATWTEAGMVAKSLLRKYRNTCFTYEGERD